MKSTPKNLTNWLWIFSRKVDSFCPSREKKVTIVCPPSLFIFAHDFRRIIKTRRGDAARRPNGGSIPFCPPSLCLRRKRAQKTYIFATTVEVKLQVMEEPPPFGPAQPCTACCTGRSTSPLGLGRDCPARTGG